MVIWESMPINLRSLFKYNLFILNKCGFIDKDTIIPCGYHVGCKIWNYFTCFFILINAENFSNISTINMSCWNFSLNYMYSWKGN